MIKNILLAVWVIGTILLAVYGQYLGAAISLLVGLQVLVLMLLMALGVLTVGMSVVITKNKNKETTDES